MSNTPRDIVVTLAVAVINFVLFLAWCAFVAAVCLHATEAKSLTAVTSAVLVLAATFRTKTNA